MVFPWVHVYYSGGLYWFVHTASVSICQNQTARSLCCCGHFCGSPSGYAEGTRETQRRSRQLLVSPECWEARWLPDWCSGPLPILSYHLSLLVSEMCGGGLIFWTHASQILLRWPLVTCVREVWFMNGSHQEYSFWQQKQIIEDDSMKQFVTSSLPLTFTCCWPIGLKGALWGDDHTESFLLLTQNVNSL